ncbi:hypothetical protein TNCV_4416121 [Trichonephila clavipes]|uniref:Uncharacterized protein n=1 Tax=Trichonephila clavipes TaxID=2585209 RepID=A0A8X6S179_TRICX|nr:hypothetical protein TNCV_4416121 [Trichonephila clavipes]
MSNFGSPSSKSPVEETSMTQVMTADTHCCQTRKTMDGKRSSVKEIDDDRDQGCVVVSNPLGAGKPTPSLALHTTVAGKCPSSPENEQERAGTGKEKDFTPCTKVILRRWSKALYLDIFSLKRPEEDCAVELVEFLRSLEIR